MRSRCRSDGSKRTDQRLADRPGTQRSPPAHGRQRGRPSGRPFCYGRTIFRRIERFLRGFRASPDRAPMAALRPIGLQRSQPNCYCPRESPRKENDVPGTRQEFIAYLTELRGELTRDLQRFESGQWKMYAGGHAGYHRRASFEPQATSGRDRQDAPRTSLEKILAGAIVERRDRTLGSPARRPPNESQNESCSIPREARRVHVGLSDKAGPGRILDRDVNANARPPARRKLERR
jgi:hypothetical protein